VNRRDGNWQSWHAADTGLIVLCYDPSQNGKMKKKKKNLGNNPSHKKRATRPPISVRVILARVKVQYCAINNDISHLAIDPIEHAPFFTRFLCLSHLIIYDRPDK